MKIGILTFHRSINYGAFMQCYALSHKLQERYPNHRVEVIDFEFLDKHNNYAKCKSSMPLLNIEYRIKYTRFQSDLALLPLSKESFITNNTDSLCEYIKRNYEIVIVGSDAVWADKQGISDDNPYWLFGDKLNSVVKMSYAASAFSTDFDNLTTEERNFYKGKLSGFSYIGVRDDATKAFVESLFVNEKQRDKIWINHDPTFFLEPSLRKDIAISALHRNLIFGGKPIMSFMTRKLSCLSNVRKEYSNKYKMLHFHIRNSIIEDIKDPKCRFVNNLSPFEWYNMYSIVSMNISNYFHGGCIGLVNLVPTIMIDDSQYNYRSKYSQVMIDLGLSDRLFLLKDLEVEQLMSTIEYCIANHEEEAKRINDGILKERKKSDSFFEFLDKILS